MEQKRTLYFGAKWWSTVLLQFARNPNWFQAVRSYILAAKSGSQRIPWTLSHSDPCKNRRKDLDIPFLRFTAIVLHIIIWCAHLSARSMFGLGPLYFRKTSSAAINTLHMKLNHRLHRNILRENVPRLWLHSIRR